MLKLDICKHKCIYVCIIVTQMRFDICCNKEIIDWLLFAVVWPQFAAQIFLKRIESLCYIKSYVKSKLRLHFERKQQNVPNAIIRQLLT